MGIYRKVILVSISILLMTAGLKLPTSAFTSCEKSKCIAKRKNINSPINFLFIDETTTDSNHSSPGDLDEHTGDLNEGGDSGDGGIVPPENDGDDSEAGNNGGGSDEDNKACALNMTKLSIEKAFVSCQIDTAIAKAEKIASIYLALHRAMKSLLNTMKRAPVCTAMGYNLNEFDQDHSILENIKELRSLIKKMKALLDALSKISLDCDNCKDDAALKASLAQVADISSQLTDLMNDFSNETAEINNRFSNFITRLQTVINLHSTTIPGIMANLSAHSGCSGS